MTVTLISCLEDYCFYSSYYRCLYRVCFCFSNGLLR